MRAYRVERVLSEGEGHAQIQTSRVLVFDLEGASEDLVLVNGVESGTSVRVEISVDGEAIYAGEESISPGESLSGIRLQTALEAGTYEALETQHLYDEEGNSLSTIRVPVTLIVG